MQFNLLPPNIRKQVIIFKHKSMLHNKMKAIIVHLGNNLATHFHIKHYKNIP
jgi:hypothetical protein